MASKKTKAAVASLKRKLSADETEQSSKSKKSKVNNSIKSKKFIISETIGLSTLESNNSSIIHSGDSRDSESSCKEIATDCVLDEFNESNVSYVSTASQTSTPTHCLEEHELCISQDISLRASQLVDELMQLVDHDDEVIISSCSQETSKLITENSNVSFSVDNEVDAYDQHYSKNKLCFTNSEHTPKDLHQTNSAAYFYGLSSKNDSNSDQKNSHISDDFSQVKANGMSADKYGDNIKKACSNKWRIRVAQHNDESNSSLVSSSVDKHLNKTTDSQIGDCNERHEEIHLKPQLHVTVSSPLKQIIDVHNKIMDKHTQKKVTLSGETNKQKQNLISDSCMLSVFTANDSEMKCIKQNDSNDSALTSLKDLKDLDFKSSSSNIGIALNNCVNNSSSFLNTSNRNKKNTETFKTSNDELDISVQKSTFVFANAALNFASECIKDVNTGKSAGGEPPSCLANKRQKVKSSTRMAKTAIAFAADRKIKISFNDDKSNLNISKQIKFDFRQQKKIVENKLDLQRIRKRRINSCKFEEFTESLRKKRLRSYSHVAAHAGKAKVINLKKINSTKDTISLNPSKKEFKHRTIKEKKASFPPVPQPSSYPSLGEGPPAPPSTGKKYVGAHISAAGGIYSVFENARAIDAKSFAMFMRSQRQWAAKPFHEDDVRRYEEAAVNFPQHLILPHGSYLMNIGSCNNELLEKSRALLQEELQRCRSLGIPHFNFHPGSCVGGISRENCCLTIAESINIAHSKVPDVIVVLENMCKQGNTIGGDFHELRLIIENVKDRRRVGVCLDTCHAHNAGYDLSTEEGFNSMILDFETIIGFQFLRGLHINDSKNVAGSHVDRHENIGKGYIGMDGMRRVLNCSHFNDMPLILETPYSNDAGYAKEIRMLEALVQQPGEEKKTKAKKGSRTASKK